VVLNLAQVSGSREHRLGHHRPAPARPEEAPLARGKFDLFRDPAADIDFPRLDPLLDRRPPPPPPPPPLTGGSFRLAGSGRHGARAFPIGRLRIVGLIDARDKVAPVVGMTVVGVTRWIIGALGVIDLLIGASMLIGRDVIINARDATCRAGT